MVSKKKSGMGPSNTVMYELTRIKSCHWRMLTETEERGVGEKTKPAATWGKKKERPSNNGGTREKLLQGASERENGRQGNEKEYTEDLCPEGGQAAPHRSYHARENGVTARPPANRIRAANVQNGGGKELRLPFRPRCGCQGEPCGRNLRVVGSNRGGFRRGTKPRREGQTVTRGSRAPRSAAPKDDGGRITPGIPEAERQEDQGRKPANYHEKSQIKVDE